MSIVDRKLYVEGENATINILLCKQSKDVLVYLTLSEDVKISRENISQICEKI